MDEDQPTFKVTDRRLFNADGSPRDLPPEEEKTEAKPAVVEEPAAATATAVATEPASTEVSPNVDEAPEEEEFSEADLADARDPASFVSFIMSIASTNGWSGAPHSTLTTQSGIDRASEPHAPRECLLEPPERPVRGAQ